MRKSLRRHRAAYFMSACLSVLLASPVLLAQEDTQRQTALRDEATDILQQPADQQDLIRLIQIDLELSDEPDAVCQATCRDLLRRLAMSENETALEHVRSVFENEPERRGSAAWALSQSTTARPADLQDWRYLVRSLTVVSGDDAVSVMKALLRFRLRANKPQWVRHVILIGLQLPPEQQPVALNLLKHWTGMPAGKSKMEWAFPEYQSWFAQEYPGQPTADLPTELEGRKWTMAILSSEIYKQDSATDHRAAGEAAYLKAGCQKCHRRGKLGDNFGPDLTSLGWRRQKSEILRAILFPSHELNEEYPTVTVVLKDGRSLSGTMSGGTAGTLSIVSSTAVRQEVVRSDVDQIVPQKISNMPEGTLETLTLEEIQALFIFLSSIDGIPRPHTDDLP